MTAGNGVFSAAQLASRSLDGTFALVDVLALTHERSTQYADSTEPHPCHVEDVRERPEGTSCASPLPNRR
jgi:hypothetical protein